MAYYHLGKVIRMRRTALNYRREDFDADGPSGMTLYRVEQGKTNATEQTYRSLTRCMGMEESTKQGVLKTDNMDVLYSVNDISRVFCEKDADKAEQLLAQIEEMVDLSVPRNRQYVEGIKAKFQYRQKQISAEEYEKVIKKALSYTIPDFGEPDGISITEWPFHEKELKLVFALNNALKAQKRYEEQKELLEKIKEVLSTDYMNKEYKDEFNIGVLVCLADTLGSMEQHEEAIKLDREIISLCKKYHEFRHISNAYFDIHWNYWELKKQKTLSAQEDDECRQCLIQAYYMSKIQNIEVNFYEKRLKERYPEELY